MGCSGSRQSMSRKTNPHLWEDLDKEPICGGSYIQEGHVSIRKTRRGHSSGKRFKFGKADRSADDSKIHQEKNKRLLGRRNSQLQSWEVLKADAALSGAMYIPELPEITQLKATSCGTNMNNMYEAGYVVPSGYNPGIAMQPPGNIPWACVNGASGQYNRNFSTNVPMINRFYSYHASGSPIVVMGQKPEADDPEILHKIIKGQENPMVRKPVFPVHMDDPLETTGNCRYWVSSPSRRQYQTSTEVLGSGYFSSSTPETKISKNCEFLADVNFEKNPSSTIADFDSIIGTEPFGLRSMSEMLKGALSDDSGSTSNQERTEKGLSLTEEAENEYFELLINEVNEKISSSSSDFDANPDITKTELIGKHNGQSNEQPVDS